MRREILAILVGFLLVFSAGCVSEEPQEKAEAGITLKVLWPGANEPTKRDLLEGYFSSFESKHAGVKVELIGVGWDEAHMKMISMIASGSAPDVINVGSRSIPELAEMKAIIPMDNYLIQEKRDLYHEGILATANYKGEQYGIPQAFSTKALYYRSDLMDNPPASWDELVEKAKTLTEKHNPASPTKYGFAIAGKRHVSTTTQLFNYIWQNNGMVFDAKGQCSLAEPPAVEALRFYTDLWLTHEVVPNPLEYHREELPTLFATGKAAMFVSGPWGKAIIGRPPDNEETPYATALLPKGKRTATTFITDSLVITSQSKHPDEAYALVDYLTSFDVQTDYELEWGMTPIMREAAGMPEYTQDPFFATFVDMTRYGKGAAQPRVPRWEPFQDIVVDMVQKVLTGQMTPEEAAAEACERTEEKGLEPVM